MNDSLYIVRNYRPADFDNYTHFSIETEKLDPAGRCISPQFLSESLRQPNYSPEQDMLVVEIDGKLVGYLNVLPELASRRVILDCLLHPKHRRKQLTRKLLDYAIRRARELNAEVVRVNISHDNTIAREALSKLGFKAARRFLELRLQLTEVSFTDANLNAHLLRRLQCDEEDKLAQIQNRCFAGSWEYNPNTTEEIAYCLNMRRCMPEDVVLIYDGDKPIGYCWTMIDSETDSADSEKKGRIYMLGVDPDYRGRGMGRVALIGGLSHLKTRGARVVDLTVNSENTAACTLYHSIGFRIRTSRLWYEKTID
ncbi:GNAT family N-acetyltransferase [Chloroflexota bacterium]